MHRHASATGVIPIENNRLTHAQIQTNREKNKTIPQQLAPSAGSLVYSVDVELVLFLHCKINKHWLIITRLESQALLLAFVLVQWSQSWRMIMSNYGVGGLRNAINNKTSLHRDIWAKFDMRIGDDKASLCDMKSKNSLTRFRNRTRYQNVTLISRQATL